MPAKAGSVPERSEIGRDVTAYWALELVIGLAKSETRWRTMTAGVRPALDFIS